MKINFYNKDKSGIDFKCELLSFHPNILLADSVMYDSVAANDLINYLLYDVLDDEMILRMAAAYFRNDKEYPGRSDTLEMFAARLKQLSKVKHKSKEALVLIGKTKMLAKESKKLLKSATEEHLAKENLLELVPFIEPEILKLKAVNYFENDGKENYYVKHIINDITDKDSIFCLEQNVEKLYRFCSLDSNDIKSCDFIKIPLWNLPMMADITYDKLRHSRDNLSTVLSPFKKQCKELREQLSVIPFANENTDSLTQLCIQHLNHHIAPVQKAIDESLYLSQQRNKFAGQIGMKFCLGIASTHFPLDYYEKNQVIVPYVVSEIKQQLSRQTDKIATCVFAYYEIHTGN